MCGVTLGTTNADAKKSNDFKNGGKRTSTMLPLAVSLPIIVFVDMFSVALVVPLLFQYYKKAGIVSSTQRELLSS